MKVTLILDDSDEYINVEDSSQVTVQLNEHGAEVTSYMMTGDMITWKKLLDNIKRVTEIHYGYEFHAEDIQ